MEALMAYMFSKADLASDTLCSHWNGTHIHQWAWPSFLYMPASFSETARTQWAKPNAHILTYPLMYLFIHSIIYSLLIKELKPKCKLKNHEILVHQRHSTPAVPEKVFTVVTL